MELIDDISVCLQSLCFHVCGRGGGCAQAYKNNDNVFIGDIYLCVFTKSYKYINNVMLYILIISAMVLK